MFDISDMLKVNVLKQKKYNINTRSNIILLPLPWRLGTLFWQSFFPWMTISLGIAPPSHLCLSPLYHQGLATYGPRREHSPAQPCKLSRPFHPSAWSLRKWTTLIFELGWFESTHCFWNQPEATKTGTVVENSHVKIISTWWLITLKTCVVNERKSL